eukprot:TRINITY_DN11367_c0_g1_i1.p1 TRINITY_DN11367_c0_g1~~TRINITY_DN11367_c0_g1_i1.p1  ORF type:complete len:566 (-),score=73.73 TRINITY_DN11367_c0_g1_i1:34-1731(-)
MQILCERVRRVAGLAQGEDKRSSKKLSIPILVMTSKLTHRSVFDHFEANDYFGVSPRDVIFFDQPVVPVLDMNGRLLPQSLGGEFAHTPGGTGAVLRALANSSALEQCRDRGVDCLHILGTDNLLGRACDPVFIGFCRNLDVDCACKVTNREDIAEDVELFCIRQSPVSTQFADVEDAACGIEASQASQEVLSARNRSGMLGYPASVTSVFMTISYIEEVVDRPVLPQKVPRVVPFLDFHVELDGEDEELHREPSSASAPSRPIRQSRGLLKGSWPAETSSPDLACQRALLAAATEIRANQKLSPDDREEAWRCEVFLDVTGPAAVVRIRGASRGPIFLPSSLGGPHGSQVARAAIQFDEGHLRCSLIVPSKPNAYVLETSILDYFAFTDRAIALKVNRAREFAPVREPKGRHTAEAARQLMRQLHSGWVLAAGGRIDDGGNPEALLEVSPLVSFEGESMGSSSQQNPAATGRGLDLDGSVLKLPCHLAAPEESCGQSQPDQDARGVESKARNAVEAGGLDTCAYYFQEYPRRPEVSASVEPQLSRPGTGSSNQQAMSRSHSLGV